MKKIKKIISFMAAFAMVITSFCGISFAEEESQDNMSIADFTIDVHALSMTVDASIIIPDSYFDSSSKVERCVEIYCVPTSVENTPDFSNMEDTCNNYDVNYQAMISWISEEPRKLEFSANVKCGENEEYYCWMRVSENADNENCVYSEVKTVSTSNVPDRTDVITNGKISINGAMYYSISEEAAKSYNIQFTCDEFNACLYREYDIVDEATGQITGKQYERIQEIQAKKIIQH